MTELIAAACALWLASLVWALCLPRWQSGARYGLSAGGVVLIAAALARLPGTGDAMLWPLRLGGDAVRFRIPAAGLWLLGFGLAPAVLACALGPPGKRGTRGWTAGAALSLLGALGVFGLQNTVAFLIAWELMSLGGAVMILSESPSRNGAREPLFMLALLEAGTVALMIALLILSQAAGTDFAHFAAAAASLAPGWRFVAGLALLIGFGAKLGLLPFYEWFPGAYGNASGASGALLSGVIFNAAFYALGHALIRWLGGAHDVYALALAVIVLASGGFTAVLAALYAFQEDDWRRLLSLSSAENAGIAVLLLGASLLFHQFAHNALAGLAWTVALLHLAGHSLAKGGLFVTADGLFQAGGSYQIRPNGWLRAGAWPLGLGALFCAMSLCAMPPQIGFVTEWYGFEILFQGFHLNDLTGRLALAIAGAGLALTAAIALATFVKLFGLGLGGARTQRPARAVPPGHALAAGILGLGVLATAVGMIHWLGALGPDVAATFGKTAPAAMHTGWILVPLTAHFAFISPAKLVIVGPLLALIPLALAWLARFRHVRRAPIWYGGLAEDPRRTATTALTFSNALRKYYSFVYRPRLETEREHEGQPYFVKRLTFTYDLAPIFGRSLFAPVTRATHRLARALRAMQSGYLHVYLSFIGLLLLVVLGLSFL